MVYPLFEQEALETGARLIIAMLAGMAIGLNRDLQNKPVGMRTLGLVSLGSALAVLACTGYGSLHFGQDAASRVIQGILTGVGFLGAGVILHDRGRMQIHGLTTAATVWIAAALGVTAGVGAWLITVLGSGLALLLLVGGGPLERVLERLIIGRSTPESEDQES
ncbi:MAG TPA: MgtC/SapB family protein [Microvirga sp.]|jgi:putative Mg2+ transporter-C (MgtC) family protein